MASLIRWPTLVELGRAMISDLQARDIKIKLQHREHVSMAQRSWCQDVHLWPVPYGHFRTKLNIKKLETLDINIWVKSVLDSLYANVQYFDFKLKEHLIWCSTSEKSSKPEGAPPSHYTLMFPNCP